MPNYVDGQVIGGPTMTMIASDKYGNPGMSKVTNANAWGQDWMAANNWGAQQTAHRMANAIDPQTGQLRPGVNPQTPDDWAEVQKQAEQHAAGEQNSNWDSIMNLLGGGAPGGGNYGTDPYGTGAINAGGRGPGHYESANGTSANGVMGSGMARWVPDAPAAAGTAATAGAAPSALASTYQNKILEMINKPGMSEQDIGRMISKGSEGLASAQDSAKQNLTASANAMGFGESGDVQAGLENLSENFAGQKADHARDVRLNANQFNSQHEMQALGEAGQYLGHQEDRAAADARYNTDAARQDRNLMISLLSNKQSATPMLGGGGQSVPTLGGGAFGGGANLGPGPGGVAGGMGNPLAQRAENLPRDTIGMQPKKNPMGLLPVGGKKVSNPFAM